MLARRSSILAVRRFCIALGLTTALAALAALGACSDEDPRFGGAGAIENIQVFDKPTTPPVEGGDDVPPRQLFTQVWTALKGPCGSCHAPPGAQQAPLFFGADEASSYTEFKARSYHLVGGKPAGATAGLTEKGQHNGRALDADEKALIARWRTAEASAGAPDAGGGG